MGRGPRSAPRGPLAPGRRSHAGADTRPANAVDPREAARRIKARAAALGFEAAGIASLAPLEARARYEAWLAAGRHGAMGYLASPGHRSRRADPTRILPGLRSVVCVALCHEPDRDAARDRRVGHIARYAAGEDYHRIMDQKLGTLERWIERDLLPGARALAYSDTGAILERGWAERAGLGWIGKHSGLLCDRFGSWFLLGELLVDRELEPDPPFGRDHCGTCQRCLDACPTGAIVAPYQVDARLCISYLTIELGGAIPPNLRPAIGDWVFGCDVCQEVCPWNRFAPPAREARLHARALTGWTLERFLTLDEQGFEDLFGGSPIRRAGRPGFLRNVCVALGNRGEISAAPAVMRALTGDPEPLVRAHAAWALGEIGRRSRGAGVEPGAAAIDRGRIAGALERATRGDAAPEVRAEARAAFARVAGGPGLSDRASTGR